MKSLVNYSSSDSEEEQLPDKSTKMLPMLLTPSKIDEENKDKPEDHQMRIRSEAHIRGNWASHIFIKSPFPMLMEKLGKSFVSTYLMESTHVSLSRTFMLKHHWIDLMTSSLKNYLLTEPMMSFTLRFSPEIMYLENDEKTRHFACISVDESSHLEVLSLIGKVDKCLKEFNLPCYYELPLLHSSILWKLEAFTLEEKSRISLEINKLYQRDAGAFQFEINHISFKTGNREFSFQL